MLYMFERERERILHTDWWAQIENNRGLDFRNVNNYKALEI